MREVRTLTAILLAVAFSGCGGEDAGRDEVQDGQPAPARNTSSLAAPSATGSSSSPDVSRDATPSAELDRGPALRPATGTPDDSGRSTPILVLVDGVLSEDNEKMLTVSAAELTRLCVTLPREVREQLLERPITVTGVVQDIQPNRMTYYKDGPKLEFHHRWTLEGGEFGPEMETAHFINCSCFSHPSESASRKTLDGIQIGQVVTVRGNLHLFDPALPGGIEIWPASIIASEPAPEDALPAEPLMSEADLETFLPHYAQGVAALEACNSSTSEAWTASGTLKPEILEGLRQLPVIEEFRVTYGAQKISGAGLQQLAELKSIRSLSINGTREDVTADDLAALAELPYLRSVNILTDSFEILAGLSRLSTLRQLIIQKPYGDESSVPPPMGLMHLRSLSIDNATDQDLASISALPRLESLTARGPSLNGAGLSKVSHLRQLASLEMSGVISSETFAAIGHLTELKRLVVSRGAPDADSFDLAFLEQLPNLQVVALKRFVSFGSQATPLDTAVTGKGENLSKLTQLQSLAIEWPALTDEDLVAFATTPKPHLKRLRLDGCGVGAAGVEVLVRQPLPQLEVLALNDTAVDDAAIAALGVAAPPALRFLELNKTRITDASLEHLRRLPALIKVNLSGTSVTDEALEASQIPYER